MPWHRLGTVSVTQNSTTVTGVNTGFAANTRIGDAFIGPDGRQYELGNVASDTVISIVPPYQGPTASGATYAIVPVQGYQKGLSDQVRDWVNTYGSKMAGLGTTGNYDVLPASKGGTGISDLSVFIQTLLNDQDAAAGRSTLVAARSGPNSDITSIAGLTKPLSVAQGGTGKITPVLEVGKGYIDGFTMVFTGRTSLKVCAGSAYVPSLGRIVTLAADKYFTEIAVTASTFHHIYLYENASGVGDVEVSVGAVPVKYYNNASRKATDASYRYLGSVLSSPSSGFFSFAHEIGTGFVRYTEANQGAAPFVVIVGTDINPTPISAWQVAPLTAYAIKAVAVLRGAGYASFYLHGQPSAPPNWISTFGSAAGTYGEVQINLSSDPGYELQFLYNIGPAGNLITVYTTGYYFNR